MEVGERLGAETFLEYMKKFGFAEKTGIDLAGEATGIIHKAENVGPVELATMSFGQSFQITPLQLLRAASAIAAFCKGACGRKRQADGGIYL